MDESELLLSITQISVAFAGFASLATIFAQRSSQDDACVNTGRLLSMLIASLAVTSLALLPFLPMLFGLNDRWIWGVSGLVGIGLILGGLPAIMRRTAAMKQHAEFKRVRSYVNFVLMWLAAVALLSCVFGVPSDQLFTAYAFALFALLIVAGNLFYSVIESLARGRRIDTAI